IHALLLHSNGCKGTDSLALDWLSLLADYLWKKPFTLVNVKNGNEEMEPITLVDLTGNPKWILSILGLGHFYPYE
ncbi:unnamed protein product, partial [Bubo scandiacus]